MVDPIRTYDGQYLQPCPCLCHRGAGCPCRLCGGAGVFIGNGTAEQDRGQVRMRARWDGDRIVKVKTTAAGGPA